MFSAHIADVLILHLRTAVYDHVQRMPIAFFGRTRTGALVSRLNNDVIGAQRAFSETLSGVVSNVVTLVLAAIAMVALSWQVTLATLVLLPLFVLPARRLGARLARLQREAANHNSTMSTQMTERFSAPRSEERRVGTEWRGRRHTRWPRDWSSDVCSSDLMSSRWSWPPSRWWRCPGR